ncbi:Rgg family transcriptional regulator [Enterococcus timonensis]|uniref:Rgg family transcriptional regulator n=1 Tax=Enterococcus timonensis TaxID=1852364 RepID=UPI002E25FDD3
MGLPKIRKITIIIPVLKAFLDELQQEYANTHDIFYLFLIVQAKAVLVRLPNYTGEKVSPEEMNKVLEYLAQVEDWGYFELAMYTNCLGLFGSEFRNFNYHDVVAQFRKFKSSSKHTLAFIKFLINSILLSFEEKNYDEVVDLLAYLYDATSDSDYIKGRLYWRFFSRLYQSITGNFEFDGSITIETFKLLGYIDEVENLLEIEHALLGEDKTGL